MAYRTPSFSSPQPEDEATARIVRGAGIPTGQQQPINPRENFEANVRAGYPSTERIIRPTGRTSSAPGMLSSSEDLAPPPAPPKLREVRSSQPLPQRTEHGHEGDSNRGVHALKEMGRSFLLSGLNPMAAAGSFIGTLINPQSVHDRDYNRDVRRYQQSAKPEIEAIEAENRGKIQQAQRDEAYYKSLESYAKIGDQRIDRRNKDEDRDIAAASRARDDVRLETSARHGQAKDAVNFAAETGNVIDPETVKGTVFERYAGQKLTKQQRDRLFQMTDADTGEESIYNYDTNERTVIPGVTGRIQREPSSGPSSGDRSLAKMNAQQRVAKEYTGAHVEQLINDYARGLYSTDAQEAGITWEDEQAAKAEGTTPEEPDYSTMSAEQLNQAVAGMLAGKAKTKGAVIRAIQARARRAAEDIVRRDLENLEQRYTEEEVGGGEKAPAASTRVDRKKKRTGLLDVQ